ncbi:hypothetical protein AB0I35_04885 [Nocardia sp. NPDC050378]|uniref:hypothetical protein n=1 Tax=Nocardia sp. NPDC050378 TaxID=3155400 RepID=UPI0033C21534
MGTAPNSDRIILRRVQTHDAESSPASRPHLERRHRATLAHIVRNLGVDPDAGSVSDPDVARTAIDSLNELIFSLDVVVDTEIGLEGRKGAVPTRVALQYLRRLRGAYASRITALEQLERMDDIKDVVEENVVDPAVRQQLSEMVTELARQQNELASKIEAQDNFEVREQKRINIMKQRWDARKAMLEREPAAVLVGGLLLLGIAVALIVAMFTHTEVPEILASGFLLILGFFFGQNSSRGESSGDSN